jgi:hypothetical protein
MPIATITLSDHRIGGHLRISSPMNFGGTGFFTGLTLPENPDKVVLYAVTARHVVDRASQYQATLLRLNLKDGGSVMVRVEVPWIVADDPAVDVAVLPWGPPPTVEFLRIPSEMWATQTVIDQEGIGIGDDIAMIGLFTARVGTDRNRSIARFGHIAAMPDEPLVDEATGMPYYAYLAEVRSIGGLSGSPVIALLEPGRVRSAGSPIELARKGFLLGLVRGHWDVKRDMSDVNFTRDELRDVNMGIAIITPLSDIAALLESEPLAAQRRQIDRKLTRERAPAED